MKEIPIHTEQTAGKLIHNPRTKLALNWLLPVIIGLFSLVTFFITVNDFHDWGGDFSLYIHQAKALLDGKVKEIYEVNKFGVENSSYSFYSPVIYPWGWPILLSPLIKLAGYNFVLMKLYVMCFFIGVVVLAYILFGKKTGMMQGLVIALCIGLNPALMDHTKHILSELPYLFFVMLSFLTYEWVLQSKNKHYGKLFLLTFILFFSAMIRTEGILLAGAVFITFGIQWAMQRFSKACLIQNKWVFIFGVSYMTLEIICKIILPSGPSSYFEHFQLISMERIKANFFAYLNSLSICFSSFLGPVFIWITLPFFFLGLNARKKEDLIIIIYCLLHLLLLLIWPHHETRYMYMFLPFYFYFLMAGLMWLKTDFTLKKIRVEPAIFSFVLIISLLSIDSYHQIITKANQPEIAEGPEATEAKEMFHHIITQSKEDDIVVFFKPRVMSLYTGRKSLIVHDQPEKIRNLADYLVLHKQYGNYLQISSLFYNPPPWLDLTFENNRFFVYQVKKLKFDP